MREHRAQALLSQLRAFTCVTEIVRDQVEALRLRCAMPGEIDHDRIFRLRTFQRIERSGFQGRRSSLTGESFDSGENVCLRRILIEQLNDLDALEASDLRLPSTHLVSKAA